MNPIIPFLLRREVILVAFVAVSIISGLARAIAQGAPDAWWLAGLTTAVYTVLAWYTHKGQPLATWAVLVLLLIQGSGMLYDGFGTLMGSLDTPLAVALPETIAGVYLTWGALVIHRERRVRD